MCNVTSSDRILETRTKRLLRLEREASRRQALLLPGDNLEAAQVDFPRCFAKIFKRRPSWSNRSRQSSASSFDWAVRQDGSAAGLDRLFKIGGHMLRTSSYTIYVDLPGNNEEMLLVHGYTGAYDKVSRRIATYVRSLELRRPPKPLYGDWSPDPDIRDQAQPPGPRAIEVLKKRGYLTEMSTEQEEEYFVKLTNKLHERQVRRMPSYMIMPTYNCNLRCSYCFQDHMRTDPRFSHLLRTMQPVMVDRIFAGMKNIEAMHGIDSSVSCHRTIGFFGGEPLLEACRPIVRHIIDQALSLGTANFWAVTNGTELHAYEDLLAPGRISALQVTIDGPPLEHDRRRIYADGSGSYEKIVRNIDMCLKKGVNINVRLNVDRTNIASLPAMVEDFHARGWAKQPNFSVYPAPIRAENEKTDAKNTFNTWELDQAIQQMIEQDSNMDVISRPDDAIKHQALQIFGSQDVSIPTFKESFCSAHTRMYIFDPFADIYACWDRTGDSKIRIGRIEDDGNVVLNAEVNALWRSRTVASNPVCRRCRYALHCGGGCAILALGKTGKYHANFCDGYASRFRAGVAEAYMDHILGVDVNKKSGRVCDQ